ncbi:MAG: SGNH/GDSL hydrolase family protein [Anaerolineae bacterium]|nr:SGNH/GDSL hydrolase family protein [Anaerolineae bacterium]
MRRAARTLFFMTLSTFIILLGCEMAARITLWHSDIRPPKDESFGFGRGGYGDLRPNMNHVEVLYPLRPYRLQTNSVGLRNTEEVIDGAYRVLALGDSFTYGYYVHNEEAWPARLEEALRQQMNGPVQVLNAGVPGYTVEDELGYLREKGLALQPDVVVLGVYTNDIMDMTPRIRQYFARAVVLEQSAPEARPLTPFQVFVRENVALYSLLIQARGAYSDYQIEAAVNRITPTIEGLRDLYLDLTFLNPEAHPDEWGGYERLLGEMAALLGERGIPLVVMMFPDLAQFPPNGLPDVPQQRITQMTAELGTPFIDLLPIYRAAGDIQSLYLMYYSDSAPVDPNAPDAAVMMYTGDGHPSAYGHLVAARALAERLIALGLIP